MFLNEQNNFELNGNNNSDGIVCDGLRLDCEPIEEYIKEINEILSQDESNFPFEYYSIKFSTFQGDFYTGYRKFLKHLVIDSSQINNDYATREYIKSIYNSKVGKAEKSKHQNEYRKHKSEFCDNALKSINERIENYKFNIKTDTKSNLESDLTITENDISINNRGKGRQCFIKTEFALQRNNTEQDLDVVLIEEPENHLSHTNMKKLVQRISESEHRQIFIATHNSLICTRLDLRKAVMLNSSSDVFSSLNQLHLETAKFFIKAPDNNILEFILSNKVILVEGDAEFMLFASFFKTVMGYDIDESDVHIISVGGTSFKRYLDIAKILNIKTAVVRDNDEDFQTNCIDNYFEYQNSNINVFFEKDDEKSTFEICMFSENEELCNELFLPGRRKLTVLQYMLKNKAEVAFQLANKDPNTMNVPDYIRKAIEWINE